MGTTGSSSWLLSEEARDLLEQAEALGLLQAGEVGALRAHLQRIEARRATAPLRKWLRHELGQPVTVGGKAFSLRDALESFRFGNESKNCGLLVDILVSLAHRISPRLHDEIREVQAGLAAGLLSSPRHPDSGLPDDRLRELAEATLRLSEDTWMETLKAPSSTASQRVPLSSSMLGVLHGGPLADVFPPRDRWRRWGSWLGHMGIRDDLLGKIHIEASHVGVLPRTYMAVLNPPSDVRLSPPVTPFGILGELGAAEAIGRALALALTSPALPSSFRFPVAGSAGRALGGVLAQLLMNRPFLRRYHALGEGDAERSVQLTTALGLLRLRTVSASLLTDVPFDDSDFRNRMERRVSLFSRALGMEIPPEMAALFMSSPFRIRDIFRGCLGALAIYSALRDRFDEDWYANPRARDSIRAGTERGGSLSVEAWCEELGGSMSDAVSRLSELGLHCS